MPHPFSVLSGERYAPDHPIPALKDNYIWAIRNGQDVIIIDPSEHQPALNFIAKMR